MTLTRFGTAPDGRPVQRIALAAGDLRLALLDRGAILQDLRLAGIDWPLTAGASDLAAYLGPLRWFGAIVGPVANRIGGARACINGRPTRFVPNEGRTLLHSGAAGTHARHWQPVEVEAGRALLRLELADGIDGFPGNRRLEAEFVLDPPATLRLILTAVTDAPTLMNLANHSYWTLDPEPGIGGQQLQIAAEHWLPVEAGLPTGEIRPVSGAMDFPRGPPPRRDRGDRPQFLPRQCAARPDRGGAPHRPVGRPSHSPPPPRACRSIPAARSTACPSRATGADRSGPSTPLRSSRSSGRTRRTGRSSPRSPSPRAKPSARRRASPSPPEPSRVPRLRDGGRAERVHSLPASAGARRSRHPDPCAPVRLSCILPVHSRLTFCR